MTEKLYDKDAYLSSFKAVVIDSGESDGKAFAVLDRTAFFPEQGGQYADTGTIGDANVTDVQISFGAIYHYTDSVLEVGREYECKIDFASRFRKMQNHSGEHIVSGIVHELYGLDNVGFHLGNSDMTVDYNGYLDRDMLREIEYRANEAVYKNLPIIAEYPTEEQLASMNYRSKLDLTENVRIVTIPGYDMCACCAPHVARTGEIGIIKLLDSIHYKGGVRIHMLCGYDALDDYNAKYDNISRAAVMLTAKQSECADAVERILNENRELKYRLIGTQRQLIKAKLAMLPETDGNICLFEEGLGMNELRETVNEAIGKCGGMCCAFSLAGHRYNYVIGSKSINMAEEAKKINTALGGRGGGSREMIQGSITATEQDIREYFGV